MKMSTKLFLFGGLLVAGLMLFSAGTVQASGTVGDSVTITYQSISGVTYNTWSLSVYVTIIGGPSLTGTKLQKMRRTGSGYAATTITDATDYDSISYQITINNGATSDTAYNITIVDTLTFWTAAQASSGNSAVYVVMTGGADSSTSRDSYSSTANGTIQSFEYTFDPAGQTGWTNAGSAGTLAAMANVGSVRGLRWFINYIKNASGSLVINFTVRLTPK